MPEDTDQPRVIDDIHYICTPIIVVVGTCGNVAAVVVLTLTKLRTLSSSYYLSALAIVDTGYLFSLFAVWLELAVGEGVLIYNVEGVCQLVTYLSYVCCFLSVWYVVAFTVERFVAVCYPLLRHRMCTTSRARLVVIALTLLALAANSYVFVVAGVVQVETGNGTSLEHICTSKEFYTPAVNVINSIDTLATLVIPLLVIIVLNIKISRTVWSLEKTTPIKNPCQTIPGRDIPCANGRQNMSALRCSRNNLHNKSQIKITKTLLVISTTFLCLNFPSYAMRVWVLFHSMYQDRQDFGTDAQYTAQQVAQLIFHINFAINFFLYSVSGANFRKALVSLFKKKRRMLAGDSCRSTAIKMSIAESTFNVECQSPPFNSTTYSGPDRVPW